jgi:hypothetical protein
MASLLAASMQTATWLSAGMGDGAFLLDWPALEPQSTRPHVKKWESEAVAEDDRCCMRARCVITERLADRRKTQKPRVVDRGPRGQVGPPSPQATPSPD